MNEIIGHVVEGDCYCVECYEHERDYGWLSENVKHAAQYPIYENEKWVSTPRCSQCLVPIFGVVQTSPGLGS